MMIEHFFLVESVMIMIKTNCRSKLYELKLGRRRQDTIEIKIEARKKRDVKASKHSLIALDYESN